MEYHIRLLCYCKTTNQLPEDVIKGNGLYGSWIKNKKVEWLNSSSPLTSNWTKIQNKLFDLWLANQCGLVDQNTIVRKPIINRKPMK